MVSVVNDGCCRNWVNGIGTPCDPPSNTGAMNVVTGNSGTVSPVWADMVTGRLMRTNRRSADTTPCRAMVRLGESVPLGNGVFDGMNTICPFTETTATSVTKNSVSVTDRDAV